jgi:hypothetical protein
MFLSLTRKHVDVVLHVWFIQDKHEANISDFVLISYWMKAGEMPLNAVRATFLH